MLPNSLGGVTLPLFKLDPRGAFKPFEEKPFGDLEKKLETWIESNPHLIAGEERFVVFGRQVHTAFGRIVDLLAIDGSGAVVVIELKRGETPRQVIAQALEYAAWIDSLSVDELDEIAVRYTSRNGGEGADLLALYEQEFGAEGDEPNDLEESEVADRVTFNHSQRVVIVAEEFSGEVEQTLRYLRSRMGLDIVGVRFGIHESGGDLLIETETLVGRELPKPPPPKRTGTVKSWSDEEIRGWVTSSFVRDAVGEIERWVEQFDNVEMRPGRKSIRAIYLNGFRTARFYYAKEWVYSWIKAPTASELEELRRRLSQPQEIVENSPRKGFTRFHLVTPADLEVYKQILRRRFES